MARNWTKIKFRTGNKVHLEWAEQAAEGKTDIVHRLESIEEPDVDLVEALAAFVPEVLKLLELPEKYGASMTVTGLAINREEDDRLGLVVTCLKTLENANAPLVVNTPHLRELGDEAVGHFLPSSMLRKLEAAFAAAERFMGGARAQQSMFGDDILSRVVTEASDELAEVLGEGNTATLRSPGKASLTIVGRAPAKRRAGDVARERRRRS